MFIIDRFEEEWAIIEKDGQVFFKLPRSVLPPAVKEGDLITVIVSKDESAAEKQKSQAAKLLKNFFDE